jgi:hypothetical protein
MKTTKNTERTTMAAEGIDATIHGTSVLDVKSWGAVVAIIFALVIILTFLFAGLGMMEITPEMVQISSGMFGYLVGRAGAM